VGIIDTSETYIKMRLAAIPDLGMGIPMGYSINWWSEYILVDEKGDWYYSTKDEAVQLERQDQLQEMVFDIENGPDTERAQQITNFYHFCMNKYRLLFTSMEQLWLAFVMKEKYGKIWSGTEWIKEN